jgi:hypothetical protein
MARGFGYLLRRVRVSPPRQLALDATFQRGRVALGGCPGKPGLLLPQRGKRFPQVPLPASAVERERLPIQRVPCIP